MHEPNPPGACAFEVVSDRLACDFQSVDFDPSAALDDGSCRATFRPGDACLVSLALAWDACAGLGDACSDSCAEAGRAANESVVAESCAEALHATGRTFAQLLGDLGAAVGAVDCTPPAVVVSVSAAVAVGGAVQLASFQAAVAAAMGGTVQASDVVVQVFEQTATAAVVLPGTPDDFDPGTDAGQAARQQFIAAISSIYAMDFRVSTACPSLFPHASATYNNVICYNDAALANAGSGPCDSWCTKDVAVGSGCGSNSNHQCATACPAAFPYASAAYGDVICYNDPGSAHAGFGACGSWCTKDVAVGSGCGSTSNHLCGVFDTSVTVLITGVSVDAGGAGRRLSESSSSGSWAAGGEGVHVDYQVVSTTLDTTAAGFDGATLSGALRDAGGTLGPFDPDEVSPLNASFTTIVQYTIALEADTLAGAAQASEAHR